MAALARALAPTTVMTDAMFDDLAAELAERQAKEFTLSDLDRDATDEEIDHAAEYSGEIAHRIAGARAVSLAGFKAKALAAVWATGGEEAFREHHRMAPGATYDQFAFSIINDLIALPSATVHAFPLALTKDAPPTSEIKKTAAEFVACRAEVMEVTRRANEAYEAASALYPKAPESIINWQTREPIFRAELVRRDEAAKQLTWPTPTNSPRVEAYDHWRAQCDAIASSFGLPGLEDASDAALAAEDAAANKVRHLAPTTIEDAALKFAVLLASYGDPKQKEIGMGEPFFEFLADLERLAGTAGN